MDKIIKNENKVRSLALIIFIVSPNKLYAYIIKIEGIIMDWNVVLNILFRAFFGYFLLLILIKLMGKREVGQLSLFDLVVLLVIADIMVLGIENYNESFFLFIIPIILLALIQKVLAFISLKSNKIRHLLDGTESVIINNGRINKKVMKKGFYNLDDLYLQLRQKNIRSVTEVQYAILESNGKLSVFTYDENKDKIFPLPLVLTGEIQTRNLKHIKKTEKWLMAELSELGYQQLNEIFLVVYENQKVKVIEPKVEE
jgi:uncharacterized membrane protein YcaP (DUF421 family)